MKLPITIIMFMVCVIILLSVVYVGVSNNLSTTGLTLGTLQDQIDSYRKKNELLEEQILKVSSLTYISAQAQKEGFTQDKLEVVIPAPLPIAYTQ